VSLSFGIFRLSWTGTELTHGSVRMTRGSPYMTWPNDRMTCGSTEQEVVVQMMTWQGDWVVWKLMW
jgi:hypothetical protein